MLVNFKILFFWNLQIIDISIKSKIWNYSKITSSLHMYAEYCKKSRLLDRGDFLPKFEPIFLICLGGLSPSIVFLLTICNSYLAHIVNSEAIPPHIRAMLCKICLVKQHYLQSFVEKDILSLSLLYK